MTSSKTFVDQSWVGSFGARAEMSYCLRVAEWAVSLPPSLLDTALQFPPFCVVRRKLPEGAILTEKLWDAEMPPLSCGVVRRYSLTHLFVHPHPEHPEGVWVPITEVEFVKPYACLSRDYLLAIRHVHLQGGLLQRPVQYVKGLLREHFPKQRGG